MRRIRGFFQRSHIAIVLLAWSILLSAIMGVVTGRIATVYSANYPYFYDPVGYHLQSLHVYGELETASRLTVAGREWLDNPRSPLRTTPLVLLWPSLLAQPLGHLATALPMLAAFLVLLGYTVYRRTEHLLYSLAVMALFCAIRGMFDPTLGLAVYWLDLHASYLVGAAALCLLNSANGRNLVALAFFALFAALATLSRFVAVGYVFFITAPILATYLVLRWRTERSIWRAVVKPALIIGVILGFLTGPFLVRHAADNVSFYTSFGYAVFNGIAAAADQMKQSLINYVNSGAMVLLLAAVVLANVLLYVFARRAAQSAAPPGASGLAIPRPAGAGNAAVSWNWTEQLAIGWLAISHVIVCIFVLRVVYDSRTPLYAWPFLFLVIVSPVPWRVPRAFGPAVLGGAIVILGASAFFASRYAANFEYAARHPDSQTQLAKQFDVELGTDLASQGNHVVWAPFYDSVGPMPSLEAYYQFQKLPLWPSKMSNAAVIFDTVAGHANIYNQQYPGLSPDEVSVKIYGAMLRWVNVVVVFDDPSAAQGRYVTVYPETIARYMAETVRSSPQWVKAFTIHSPTYGQLVGYRNLAADPAAYDWLLTHYTQSLPDHD